ncbi:ADP-ribosylation factor GTPase-activating protein AGD7 [Abeliophyllum distichum]|uniref:ADP-ribosylation factor GTPase-activating protein AGD7 n=1 Tax=Abeliophyllum distichum TaxID=126358 RepID=A0ABD1P463_9LAMI
MAFFHLTHSYKIACQVIKLQEPPHLSPFTFLSLYFYPFQNLTLPGSRRLRELQSQPENKICMDCSQKNPQWASISYGVFMCLECSSKHRGLGIHISFVRSVTMDSWSEIQLKKMELGENERVNQFILQYGIPEETNIVTKYNTNAASVYRDRIQSLTEGKLWRNPPVVKETIRSGYIRVIIIIINLRWVVGEREEW